jgi:hypothetical protein
MEQRAKIGRPHVMYRSENSADLFGFGRQYPQIRRNLRLQSGSAAGGLVVTHDDVKPIRILALLQLINT